MIPNSKQELQMAKETNSKLYCLLSKSYIILDFKKAFLLSALSAEGLPTNSFHELPPLPQKNTSNPAKCRENA